MGAAGMTDATDMTMQRSPIAELARTGELRWKDGRDIVVALKDAGHGPMVDLREYVTPDAYTPDDYGDAGKMVRVGKGKAQRFVKLREPYIGPTKVGFWMSPELAQGIALAILEAIERVEES